MGRWRLAFFAFVTLIVASPAARAIAATGPVHLQPSAQDSLFSLSFADLSLPVTDMNDFRDESSSASSNVPAEVSDGVRHRDMVKFLLVVLVLGSVIRFVTSPAYLDFIADVLDPKSF